MARTLRRQISNSKIMFPRGVAVSGLEFAPSTLPGVAETNYTKNTNSEYSYLAGLGFNVIRLPFIWNRIQPTLGGALDASYKALIDQNITWAGNNGLKVLLDLHNYGRYNVAGTDKAVGASGGPTQSDFVDVWDKLAQAYNNNSTVWGYGLMNEPHDMPVDTNNSNYNSTSTLYLMIQAAITQIRTRDTSHYITACTDGWSGFQNFFNTYGSNPTSWWTDSAGKFYYEIHAYFDNDNSGTYSGANASQAGSGRDIRYAGDKLKLVADWASNRGVKLLIGELGIPIGDQGWYTMVEDFYRVADEYQIPVFYWAIGQWYSSSTGVSPTNNYTMDRPQMEFIKKHLGTTN